MSAAGHFAYWAAVFLMMAGLYIVIARDNLVKKLVGLSLLQSSVYLLYIAPGKLPGGTAPIIDEAAQRIYSNPLPHVLILTAIVVGVATLALGLALVVRIREAYGTIEEDDILEIESAEAAPGGGYGSLGGRTIADVGGDRQGARLAAERVYERVQPLGPPRHQCDPHAARGEIASQLLADAARSAGHQRDALPILTPAHANPSARL